MRWVQNNKGILIPRKEAGFIVCGPAFFKGSSPSTGTIIDTTRTNSGLYTVTSGNLEWLGKGSRSTYIGMVYTTSTRSAGKLAFACHLIGVHQNDPYHGGINIGIVDPSSPAYYAGAEADSRGFSPTRSPTLYFPTGNGVYSTPAPISTVAAPGDWFTLLVDFDAGKIWEMLNGTPNGNPAAGTGQACSFTPNTPMQAAMASYYGSGDDVMFAFTAATMGYALPTGFKGWDD